MNSYTTTKEGQHPTACKQYCLAAGATQGNIAYTQNVMVKHEPKLHNS
jgi:hypothetical protein